MSISCRLGAAFNVGSMQLEGINQPLSAIQLRDRSLPEELACRTTSGDRASQSAPSDLPQPTLVDAIDGTRDVTPVWSWKQTYAGAHECPTTTIHVE